GHQALHARVLGFVHPTSGKRLHFEAPPPADFLSALTALRPASP
ncbi:MAG: RluA family pseudouridine synthase, partial [Polyangiaceae bacterium]